MTTTEQIIHAAAVEIAGELEPPKHWCASTLTIDQNGAVAMIEPIIRKACEDYLQAWLCRTYKPLPLPND